MNTSLKPITIVIFGASGDLTHRKLVPSLFSLFRKQRLPETVHVVGFARRPFSDSQFASGLKDSAQQSLGSFDDAGWDAFAPRLHYFEGDLAVADDFARLKNQLGGMEGGGANRLYYLATSPDYYVSIVENLGRAGMAEQSDGWRRIIVEKPFGHDLESAQALNQSIHAVFGEDQVYRIDHYLGKETAQNILFFRFANTIFAPVWNRRYVDHVQSSVAETLPVGHRAGYYDKAGILRDVFQNHLLQLLTLIGMEPPSSFNPDALRNEKVKVLRAIRPVELTDTVFGQYDGYLDEPQVAPDSRTPTFAALKLFIDNWRWQGVPFYLRSGKSLASKVTEIVIQFQCPPHVMFNLPAGNSFTPNILSMCIQPDEGVHLKFEIKIPDSNQETRSVDMEFHYCSSFDRDAMPDAYERLLLDAINGDAALFTRNDEIETAWSIIDPLTRAWEAPDGPPIALYKPGSWGPLKAKHFLLRDRRIWRRVCSDSTDGCGGSVESD
jgi:glucose-6-phosphate 1-dehydrogenase